MNNEGDNSQEFIQYINMYQPREPKIGQQRNITPNFLKFKRKSSSKHGKNEQQQPQSNIHSQRSNSRTSRPSFDVYVKRELHLSKLKNTLNIKNRKEEKESSVDPTKRKREGLEVVSRRNNSNTKQEESSSNKYYEKIVSKKKTGGLSIKNLRPPSSKQKEPLTARERSNPKHTEESLEKEEQFAVLNKPTMMHNMMNQQQIPNLYNKLKIKKIQQKQTSKKMKRKMLALDIQIKGDQELKNYVIYEELGKGAYGVVKMGICKKTNDKVAIKIYEKKKLDEPNKIKNLEREINILSKLDHPVIAKLIQAIETSTQIYLIQEYGGANSLYNYLLSKPQHRMQETQAKQFFRVIADTLKYLHVRNIVHRDIKAQNILINRNKQLKVIDFGFSLESVPPSTIDTFCGTPTYMAPEIVSKKDHVPIYTDMWSLGILLFVMLNGNYPFRAKNQNQLFEKIRKGQFEYLQKDVSEKSKVVIQKLVRVNPLDRMMSRDINEQFWDWWMGDKYVGENTTAATNF